MWLLKMASSIQSRAGKMIISLFYEPGNHTEHLDMRN
jgi:hypothetical protein